MNSPADSRYVCTPLRTQLPVLSNHQFIRAWMVRQAAAKIAAAPLAGAKASSSPGLAAPASVGQR